MKKIIKPSILIVAFIILLLFFYPYIISLSKSIILSFSIINLLNILWAISLYILFGFAVYILYRYLILMLNLFKDKKIAKSICMLILAILILAITILIKVSLRYFIKNLLLLFVYIIGVIALPLIMIGFAILDERKNKIKIIVTILITIVIYISNATTLNWAANTLVNYFSDNSISEIFGNSNENINILYLENYYQKMGTVGYLTKFDIQNLLDIVNSRADFIKINYDKDDILIKTNNKEKNWRQNLEGELEGNYYKFQYDYNNNETNIYIQKYTTNSKEDNEKNKNIVIEGTLKENIIENTKTYYDNMEANNYTFDNKIILDEKGTNAELEKFKVLFVYDEKTNNFIPYTDNESELKKIKSYIVYSTGISITLEDEVKITKSYYTIRINRYDSNYKLKTENDNKYYYKFEPVVTTLTDWNNNTVLEIKFDSTYQLKNLKNIEILFGYSD